MKKLPIIISIVAVIISLFALNNSVHFNQNGYVKIDEINYNIENNEFSSVFENSQLVGIKVSVMSFNKKLTGTPLAFSLIVNGEQCTNVNSNAYNNPFYGYIEKGTVKDGYIYFAVPFNIETIYLVSNYEELAFSFNLK